VRAKDYHFSGLTIFGSQAKWVCKCWFTLNASSGQD